MEGVSSVAAALAKERVATRRGPDDRTKSAQRQRGFAAGGLAGPSADGTGAHQRTSLTRLIEEGPHLVVQETPLAIVVRAKPMLAEIRADAASD